MYLEGRNASVVEFPVGGVMVLGHNFDSECGFNDSSQRGKEILTRGTWLGVLNRLEAVPIPPYECFFTNAFMGLCKGRKNTVYQGRNDQRFREACARFLRFQVEVQRPRLILTLGLKVPPLLQSITSDLGPWQGRLKRNSCDPELSTNAINSTPILTARFKLEDGSEHRAVVVPITHPGESRNLSIRILPVFQAGCRVRSN